MHLMHRLRQRACTRRRRPQHHMDPRLTASTPLRRPHHSTCRHRTTHPPLTIPMQHTHPRMLRISHHHQRTLTTPTPLRPRHSRRLSTIHHAPHRVQSVRRYPAYQAHWNMAPLHHQQRHRQRLLIHRLMRPKALLPRRILLHLNLLNFQTHN
jgi:hypothetical protein